MTQDESARQPEASAAQLENESASGKRESLRSVFSVPTFSFAFLGIGVYRAWIEAAFVGSFVPFPTMPIPVRNWFDIFGIVVMLVCVGLTRRIGPFYNRRLIFILCGVSATAGTAFLFISATTPGLSPLVPWLAAAFGGIGMGLIILIWSEVYGCLNPFRVTVYYCGSIIAGGLIVYTLMGFMTPWLIVFTTALPIVSLNMAYRAMKHVPPVDRPSPRYGLYKAPWKIFLLMALYGFAYGLIEQQAYSGMFGPHSAPAVLIVAAVILALVLMRRESFDFLFIVRIGLPLTVIALWMIPALNSAGNDISGACAIGGYTAFTVLIMVLCSNLCYRYGTSAIWLFGIERSLRLLFMMLGRGATMVASGYEIIGIPGEQLTSGLTILLVVIATTLLISQKDITGQWKESLRVDKKHQEEMRMDALMDHCAQLADKHGLTARETEVLRLLAQRKTVGMIERECHIANGTAKAHIRHIYQKLDIHSRKELFDMLDMPGE